MGKGGHSQTERARSMGSLWPWPSTAHEAAGWHQLGVLWISFWGCVPHRPPGPQLEFSPVTILKILHHF